MGLFSGVGLWTLVPLKGTPNASAYRDSSDYCLETVEDGPFLFQHDCTPVHKTTAIKTWMRDLSHG